MSRREQNIRYWTDFCDYLSKQGSQLQYQNSKERHFIDFRIGTGCFLRARQVIQSQYGPTAITVGFIMKGSAMAYFHSFEKEKKEIESQFGKPLDWYAGYKHEKHVALRKVADPSDENDWPRQYQWLATNLEKLNEVFRPRIEK